MTDADKKIIEALKQNSSPDSEALWARISSRISAPESPKKTAWLRPSQWAHYKLAPALLCAAVLLFTGVIEQQHRQAVQEINTHFEALFIESGGENRNGDVDWIDSII